MYDVWHVLANDDAEKRQASRTAVAMANKRVQDKYGQFLATDVEARFEFVRDEIEALVTATAEEYDADPAPILAGVLASLTPQKQIEPRTAAVVEARKPKLCPYHSEVMDISLAEGSPRAGFDAMAQHAWGPKHCKGDEYEGSKCNFKKEFTTQAFWDDKKEQAEQRRQEREELRAQPVEELVVDEITEDEPELIEETPVEETSDDNVVEVDFSGEVDGEPSAVGEGAPEELAVAASTDAPFPKSANPAAPAASAPCPYCNGRGATGEGLCPQCGGTGSVAGGAAFRGYATEAMVKEAPGGQHSEAWGESGSKRNRQYEHIKEQCLADGGSEEHCKEMAARTVNKTRSEHGETKSKVAGPYDGPNSVNNQNYEEFGEYGLEPDPWGDQGQSEAWCQYCQGRGCDYCGGSGYSDAHEVRLPSQQTPTGGPEPGYHGYASVIAEALETVDIEKNTHPDYKRDRGPGEQPDDEMDGSPHPTVTVDITEPIVYKNDETPFEGTNAVSEKQDVEKAEGAQKGKGGTFPKGNGANPVTSATLQKMGLTARDFVAIAHILATSPGGPDPQLAEHFADYLANTNPQFDRERFIAAAGGVPSTGRDNYRDQYGPTLGAADVRTNPVREILLEQEEDGFLGNDEVAVALAKRR